MIKPREMWAVISPDDEIEELRSFKGWAINCWLDVYGTEGGSMTWDKAKAQGFRCVKVKITAEEL